MDLDFDETFKIPAIALNITRAHPYIPRDKKWAVQFIALHGIFTLVCSIIIYNIAYHDLKSDNFSQICKNGILCVVYFVITFQYCILLLHQDSLVEVINDIKRDYEACKHLRSNERDVVCKYVDMGISVCKQWLILGIVGPSLFLLKSVFGMIYYYCIGDFKLLPYHDLIYPPLIQENKDNILVYLLTYYLIAHFGYYSGFMYWAYVPLGPIFILHACGQLELVAMKIDDLFVECDDEIIRMKLKDIIQHFQYIYSFVDRLNRIFKIAYELTLKGTTLMLPITCYEVIESLGRNEVNLEYFTFIVGSTLFSSSPCYYSDLLMEKGERVRQSLYTCGWERCYDRRTRTTIQLMLQNALKPVAICSVFRVLCLETLNDVFQQSYAIFNLMNAMWS